MPALFQATARRGRRSDAQRTSGSEVRYPSADTAEGVVEVPFLSDRDSKQRVAREAARARAGAPDQTAQARASPNADHPPRARNAASLREIAAPWPPMGRSRRPLIARRNISWIGAPQAVDGDGAGGFSLAGVSPTVGCRERIVSDAEPVGYAELIGLYWRLGRLIIERMHDAGWGALVIERLSADLRAEFPAMRGLSPSNLKYMRRFSEAWPDGPIGQRVVDQLPWCHNIELLARLTAPSERLWYAEQAARHGWSATRSLTRSPRSFTFGLARRRPTSPPRCRQSSRT